MAITIEYRIEDSASPRLAALIDALENRAALHQAMGDAVAEHVRDHIATTKDSPNTGWWARVADSVTHTHAATRATVTVPEPGAALRYHGGRVEKKPGGPHLALPTKRVPVKDNTRAAARDMGDLAYIRASAARRATGTVAYLVTGEPYTITRGPSAGQQGTRPVGSLPDNILYILRTHTDHPDDRTVLPSGQQLGQAAREAGEDYLGFL